MFNQLELSVSQLDASEYPEAKPIDISIPSGVESLLVVVVESRETSNPSQTPRLLSCTNWRVEPGQSYSQFNTFSAS
jgi:hypothetical protein